MLFRSNLIRSANDRGIAVTIDYESGGVDISEPVNDADRVNHDNFGMLKLLYEHFDLLQADAFRFLQTNLPMTEQTDD